MCLEENSIAYLYEVTGSRRHHEPGERKYQMRGKENCEAQKRILSKARSKHTETRYISVYCKCSNE